MTDNLTSLAFNHGSDSRLRGEPVTANPHSAAGHDSVFRAWREGWHSVDRGWGRGVLGRWQVRTLPAVVAMAG